LGVYAKPEVKDFLSYGEQFDGTTNFPVISPEITGRGKF